MTLLTPAVEALIDLALEEDLGRGDVTTMAVLDGDGGAARGIFLAKTDLVVFGLEIVRRVVERVDPRAVFSSRVADGARVARGAVLAEVAAPAASLLRAERTALNFLQRLSGIATLSRRYADAVAGTRTRVVDTRKTTPGWRALEKAAVVAGGCANHRPDLGGGVLIKDNHIAACGGVRAAVERARVRAPHPFRIEVEVTTRTELEEAIAAGAEVVLLDNMDLHAIADCVALAHARNVLVEVSGGVTLETIRAIAETGADLVSVGALTHSAPAVDISFELERIT